MPTPQERREALIERLEGARIAENLAMLEALADQWQACQRALVLSEHARTEYTLGHLPEALGLALTFWRSRAHFYRSLTEK